MDLHDKRVLVVGLGKSGVASALFLKSRGARVTVSDTKPETELRDEILLLLEHGITVETGGHGDRTFRGQDLIVVSPGVPVDAPQLVQARNLGETVIGEIELAAQFLAGQIVAITGPTAKPPLPLWPAKLLPPENSPRWWAVTSARRPSVLWIRPAPRPGPCWKYRAFSWRRSLNFVLGSR